MTTLVVEELKTALVQPFTWSPRPRAHVVAARIHLYVHNAPAGTFKLQILDSDDNVRAEKTFTAAQVYAGLGTTNLYAQAYHPIIFDNQAHLPPGQYKLRLSATGYSFSTASYLAWVRDHEDLKTPITFTPASDLENPLSYEIWVNK